MCVTYFAEKASIKVLNITEYYYLFEKKSTKLDILQTPGFHHKFKYISSAAVNNTGCTES